MNDARIMIHQAENFIGHTTSIIIQLFYLDIWCSEGYWQTFLFNELLISRLVREKIICNSLYKKDNCNQLEKYRFKFSVHDQKKGSTVKQYRYI